MNNYIYRDHLICKRFGQIFLKDRSMIERIVFAINPQHSQLMVEIGSGLAALTEPIGKYLDHLIAIELDRNLATRLLNHPLLRSKLTIYQQDATSVDFINISKQKGKLLRIFGSLPYNIAIKIIFHLFECISVIFDMYFIIQKEVAYRLIAKPDSKSYGQLSIIAQYYCQVVLVFEVPPSCFIPQPKVDSALVKLVPHHVLPYTVKDPLMLKYITFKAFNQRRKMVRNSLKDLFTPHLLIQMDIDPKMRAENLSIIQYCKLANYISNYSSINKR